MKIHGTDLRRMRLIAGRTTIQMAEYAKVKTRKTYENWEKGISTPNINQFFAMASACGYNAVQLVELVYQRGDGEDTIAVEVAKVE